MLAPILDTDFLHPNQLTQESVQTIFAESCQEYEKTHTSFV